MLQTRSEGVHRADTAPSVFAISAVFGGSLGMAAASAFGVDAGGGFIVGAVLVFMFLSIAVLIARIVERTATRDEALDALVRSFVLAGSDGGEFGDKTDFARELRRFLDRDR